MNYIITDEINDKLGGISIRKNQSEGTTVAYGFKVVDFKYLIDFIKINGIVVTNNLLSIIREVSKKLQIKQSNKISFIGIEIRNKLINLYFSYNDSFSFISKIYNSKIDNELIKDSVRISFDTNLDCITMIKFYCNNRKIKRQSKNYLFYYNTNKLVVTQICNHFKIKDKTCVPEILKEEYEAIDNKEQYKISYALRENSDQVYLYKKKLYK